MAFVLFLEDIVGQTLNSQGYAQIRKSREYVSFYVDRIPVSLWKIKIAVSESRSSLLFAIIAPLLALIKVNSPRRGKYSGFYVIQL